MPNLPTTMPPARLAIASASRRGRPAATMVAAGLSLRDALPIANRAGGIVVGKFGTATVSYEELFA